MGTLALPCLYLGDKFKEYTRHQRAFSFPLVASSGLKTLKPNMSHQATELSAQWCQDPHF